jgi:hypothetical protein
MYLTQDEISCGFMCILFFVKSGKRFEWLSDCHVKKKLISIVLLTRVTKAAIHIEHYFPVLCCHNSFKFKYTYSKMCLNEIGSSKFVAFELTIDRFHDP